MATDIHRLDGVYHRERGAGRPNGASGIEFGEFALTFQPNKIIVFLAKASGVHYTLHFGNKSGVLDLHRTSTDPNGQPCHERLFAIRHADMARLLGEAIPTMIGMTGLFRRLRPGWLIRHNIGIVKGLELTTDEQIRAVTSKMKRKRLVLNEALALDNVYAPMYLDDVWNGPDGWFSLFAGRRRIGLGVKATDSAGRARLFWVKCRDLVRFSARAQGQLIDAVGRYSIPPDKYGCYNIE